MKYIHDYLEKYGKLSLRERLLVLAAVAAALYFMFDALLLAPQQQRIKQLNQSAQAHQQEKGVLVAQLVAMEGVKSKAVDLAQSQRNEMAALQKQIAAAEVFYGQSDQRSSSLGVLLHELLATNPRVSLTGLKTQPSSVFFAPTVAAAGNKAAQAGPELKDIVYRSGVEVSLKGSFPALLTYLQALERRSDRLFWSNAHLDVSVYPDVVLRLDIATLGNDASVSLK